jgi:hypothetical protein
VNTRPDGTDRPPLAHHADQLRVVVPDGHEDLGYAAAFEIGRLLALSQPGVAAALARWRQDAFGAARVRSASEDAFATAPARFRARVLAPDPLTDDTPDRLRAAGAGRRSVRAVFDMFADAPEAIAPARPRADPAAATREIHRLVGDNRDIAIARGFGLEATFDGIDLKDVPAVANVLANTAAQVAGERNPDADLKVVRQALESEAGRVADSVTRFAAANRFGFDRGGDQ